MLSPDVAKGLNANWTALSGEIGHDCQKSLSALVAILFRCMDCGAYADHFQIASIQAVGPPRCLSCPTRTYKHAFGIFQPHLLHIVNSFQVRFQPSVRVLIANEKCVKAGVNISEISSRNRISQPWRGPVEK